MTTLASNAPRDYQIGDFDEQPVIANDIIFEGAAVGENGSGYARPLEAGDPFLGFAVQKCDNTGGSAGDKRVLLRPAGKILLAIGSLAITDIGKDVYASDDDTFTLTAGSNTRVGHVSRFVSSGHGIVEFSAVNSRMAELTDSSGGTPGDTIAAISGSYTQAEIANGFASVTARINAIIRRLGA